MSSILIGGKTSSENEVSQAALLLTREPSESKPAQEHHLLAGVVAACPKLCNGAVSISDGPFSISKEE